MTPKDRAMLTVIFYTVAVIAGVQLATLFTR